MFGDADTEFPVTAISATLSIDPESRQRKLMFFVLFFFRNNLEPLQEQFLCLGSYGCCIQLGREFKFVQQFRVIFGNGVFLTEHPHPVGKGERGEKIKILHRNAFVLLHKGGGICLPQLGKDWPFFNFFTEDTVFQSQPHEPLISIALFILLKTVQHFLQNRIIIMLPHGTDDAVPVKIGNPAAVISFKIRAEGVVPGAAPDNIFCSLLLKLCDFRNHVLTDPLF